MTVEELLKPRYKVIADYPGNNIAIGKILVLEGFSENQQIELCYYYNKYPHLFKKLEWHEEREEKDMPEYIKSKDKVRKVPKWEGTMAVFNKDIPYNKDISWMPTGEWLPATKEEYEAQASSPMTILKMYIVCQE